MVRKSVVIKPPSSSSSSTLELEREEEISPYLYPYPSNLNATSFVSIKLTRERDYLLWKTQLLCLIQSHDMYGFIDGTFKSPPKDDNEANYVSWRRSDTVVRGWIFGSVASEVLENVAELETAYEVWRNLETVYSRRDPSKVSPSQKNVITRLNTRKGLGEYMPLYKAAVEGNWEKAEEIFTNNQQTVTARLDKTGYTTLHVAVGTGDVGINFVGKLVQKIPPYVLPTLVTYENYTALHIAAIVGNTKAAKILVKERPSLLYTADGHGYFPIHLALFNSHKHTFRYLRSVTESSVRADPYADQMGVTLLSYSIFVGYYDVALDLVKRSLPSSLATTIPNDVNIDTPLMAIAKKANAFRSGTDYNFLESLIYLCVTVKKGKNFGNHTYRADIENQANCSQPVQFVMHRVNDSAKWLRSRNYKYLNYLNPVWHIRCIRKEKSVHYQARELLKHFCEEIKNLNMPSAYSNHYKNPIIEAVCNDAYEVVQEILETFPQAIWCTHESGHHIIQLAILNRCDKVYNLMVYKKSEHVHFYRTVRDKYNNNILHLAGKFGVEQKQKLDHVSGAALQMQRELQWFKEVEKLVDLKAKISRNSDGETPQMVFTREHNNLVKEGEEWTKKTAESYTITAALIITIVFAAAITVPGGNSGDTGQPIYTKRGAFIIFAIADAISLFTSTTSLLLFLSILTARFAEQDFHYTLPTRIVLGLLTLFLSTTFMIIAFGATLYLMFGQGKARILIPIASLACLPIASFVFLQYPLIRDLISSTYVHGLFGK